MPYEKSNTREPKAEKPVWLTQNKPPSKGKLKEARDWNGTDWWWCSEATGGKCNDCWRAHKPSQCCGLKRKEAKTEPGKKKRSPFGHPPGLALAQEARVALENAGIDPDAILQADDESE